MLRLIFESAIRCGGKTWQQEFEAADHVAPITRMQRVMDASE